MTTLSVVRRWMPAALVTLGAALALFPAAAGAGGIPIGLADVPRTSCVPGGSSPFLPWGDPANYSLLPGGDFERGGAGWSLSGAARVVSGNEPWRVSQPSDSRSLFLPAGSSATSPAICAGLADPTIRFFAARMDGDEGSRLDVYALVRLAGATRTFPIGSISGGGAWRPTPVIPFLANVSAIASSDGTTQVSFRFSAREGGWAIDDVYVDPLKSH